ncbi:hypothetical protein AGMMS49573_00250 [Endomicrobiia bacterium]|uniref:hypothetical protein n=1 Tax=Endomicrobium trichonymphae TaxID=1408204 RepID=UPI000BBA9AC5|nr:hypothetical protein [Candidatus Endomicrobium trichonymphae]GHT04870.1 hypothetical protein AGMMS49523_03190 [Endomicrobiia bacterium]GHT07823.1 hypothetical protein AGMMS49532_01410 [Endomicrobiia bacterium]GHT12170.1 hypothetical protein AGMMS49571_03700 [Endomicrobiia bacterium]GHT15009.1 hypothetical protein AGMMS49573_00250 [Endomicrobiia bacterium]GHT20595.1 hypothetical protein AGMMS49929_07690 [Endomicrobiia bacterium]
MKGINSIGFDILPMSKIAISAKEAVYKYCTSELIKDIENLLLPTDYTKRTTYINITEGHIPMKRREKYPFLQNGIKKFQIFGDH